MRKLSREQIKKILEYLEEETNITKQQLWRVIEKHGGILHGGVDTAKERKYGSEVTSGERKDMFEEAMNEMRLSEDQKRKVRYAINPQHLDETLRKIEKEEK